MEKKKAARIFLTGFMCSGKSTIGAILANTLGRNFFDMDHEIEKKAQMSVREIFETFGENYFRNFEHNVLGEIITEENAIISLGGGTIIAEDNVKLMKQNGIIVYLKLSDKIIYERIKFKVDRPVFQTVEEFPLPKDIAVAKIQRMLSEREQYYMQSDLIFEPINLSIGKTVDALAKLLHDYKS